MDLVIKIQQINDYYDFRRAKRDHRNPSTGAFEAYERSGVVKLNYCIETGDKDACVHIQDKTGYLKISQEIEEPYYDIPDGYSDYLTVSAYIDIDTPANNFLVFSDENDNDAGVPFISIDGNLVSFGNIKGGATYDINTGKLTEIHNDTVTVTDPTTSRDVQGNIRAIGYINGDFFTVPMIIVPDVFPIWL